MQSSIVLQSITKSYAWGLISSRDFVDLIKWGCVEDSGLYYTCGMSSVATYACKTNFI